MPPDQIRLSETAKDQLSQLKRRTGIKNWNVLCRWAFCRSLAEPTPPSPVPIPADSSVEMTWKVFGGANADVYWALLRQRAHADGQALDEDSLQKLFRLHLHRGISYLVGEKTLVSIEALVGNACK
jgi:DNA sulfur modification protein DndE